MNYLAHLFLSFDHRNLVVGNFITDMVNKKESDSLDESLQSGIGMHRMIDTYTDDHPIFKSHLKLLYPHFSKYSPVVLDIYYDYLLFNNWSKFTKEPFDEFQQRVYSDLISAKDLMPEKIRRRVDGMVADSWLRHYTNPEGMEKVFVRLMKIIRFKTDLSDVTEKLEPHFELMNEEFVDFFTDLINYLEASFDPNLRSGGKY